MNYIMINFNNNNKVNKNKVNKNKVIIKNYINNINYND